MSQTPTNAYCDAAEKINAIYSALHADIQNVFNEFGVQMISPNHVADPQLLRFTPPDQWYSAPAEKPAK